MSLGHIYCLFKYNWRAATVGAAKRYFVATLCFLWTMPYQPHASGSFEGRALSKCTRRNSGCSKNIHAVNIKELSVMTQSYRVPSHVANNCQYGRRATNEIQTRNYFLMMFETV
jgi:hypothetical protein